MFTARSCCAFATSIVSLGGLHYQGANNSLMGRVFAPSMCNKLSVLHFDTPSGNYRQGTLKIQPPTWPNGLFHALQPRQLRNKHKALAVCSIFKRVQQPTVLVGLEEALYPGSKCLHILLNTIEKSFGSETTYKPMPGERVLVTMLPGGVVLHESEAEWCHTLLHLVLIM